MVSYCSGVVSLEIELAHDRRGVHQDVEPAEAVHHPGRQPLRRVGIGEIRREALGAAARRGHFVAQRAGAIRGCVMVNGERHAPPGEGAGHLPAEPAARPGHERDAALELHQAPPEAAGAIGRM